MKPIAYILEMCGWALVLFTLIWGISGTLRLEYLVNSGDGFWDIVQTFSSLGALMLDGFILGLIAVLAARLARHPEAASLGKMATRMISSARSWENQLDD